MDAIYYSNQRPKHVTSEISAKRSRLCSSLAPYHVSRHISYYTMCLGEQSLYLVAGSRTRTGLWLGALGFASITTCAIRSTACTTAPGTRNLQRKNTNASNKRVQSLQYEGDDLSIRAREDANLPARRRFLDRARASRSYGSVSPYGNGKYTGTLVVPVNSARRGTDRPPQKSSSLALTHCIRGLRWLVSTSTLLFAPFLARSGRRSSRPHLSFSTLIQHTLS